MVFSDPINNSGIFEETKFQIGLDNDSNNIIYKKSDFARHINMGMDELFFLITKSDQTWEWDDKRYTDLPIGRADLVTAQRDYTFDATHLKVLRVEIKTDDDIWNLIEPIDQREIKQGLEEFQKTNGTPRYYDKLANQIFLYPPTNYNKQLGLKVEFQRAAKRYIGDGTDDLEEPGFDSVFHEYLTLFAAYKYASSRPDMKDQESDFFQRLNIMKEEIKYEYGHRNEDRKTKLTLRQVRSW